MLVICSICSKTAAVRFQNQLFSPGPYRSPSPSRPQFFLKLLAFILKLALRTSRIRQHTLVYAPHPQLKTPSSCTKRNADYRMCSTFLTVSTGSVLFSRSNLLTRQVLGLTKYRRSFGAIYAVVSLCISATMRKPAVLSSRHLEGVTPNRGRQLVWFTYKVSGVMCSASASEHFWRSGLSRDGFIALKGGIVRFRCSNESNQRQSEIAARM